MVILRTVGSRGELCVSVFYISRFTKQTVNHAKNKLQKNRDIIRFFTAWNILLFFEGSTPWRRTENPDSVQ